MIEKPFPARKERRLDAETPQSVNDLSIIAGDFVSIFTKIECQCHKLLSMRELHAAYRPAHVSWQLRKNDSLARWLDRGVVRNPMNGFLIRLSGQSLRRPAARTFRRSGILRPARRLE